MSENRIPFTQYMLPNGRQVDTSFPADDLTHEAAQKIIAQGARFAAEVLRTGAVSLTVEYDDDDIAIEVVPNGPEVLSAIVKLVKDATNELAVLAAP